MTTRTLPVKSEKVLPLEKTDIHYDPSSEEVSIKRDKFDAFVKYVQTLEEKLEAAEDARDVAQYHARKAGMTADLLEGLIQVVDQATAAIRAWLSSPEHTLQQLSERTRIPYATCHRIVNERLGTESLEFGYLQKMLSAVAKKGVRAIEGKLVPRFDRVLFGFAKKVHENEIVSCWKSKGSEVTTVHTGADIAKKVQELLPDLIVLDVAMPNLERSGLEQLRQFAKNQKGTIVLTGSIAEANATLLQCSVGPEYLGGKQKNETKTAGG